jgi:hypothetical protein
MSKSLLRQYLAGHLPPPKNYVPDFKVRDQDEFILISDGDKPVATFNRETLMIDLSEFHPDGRAKATLNIRRPYHNVGFCGTMIPCNGKHKSQIVDSLSNTVEIVETGERLVLRLDETFGEDEPGLTVITLHYDPELGCYAVDRNATLAMLNPTNVEAANLWANGAGMAWPSEAMLRYTLWSNVDGELTWFPHNPLTPNLSGFTPQPYGRVTWDRDARGLVMEGRDERADLSSLPCGPGIRCHENTGYLLSAKIRTELEEGGEAWLELTPFLYSPSEVKEPVMSPGLTGVKDGTAISVSIPPSPDKDYLSVALRMRGKGKVWFDEVALMPE